MTVLLRIASNTGLVSFLAMSVLSLWRLTVFLGKFARDGHWYRCVHWLRPVCGAFPLMRCVGAAAESEDETRPLQPVQIQSLMAQRKLEIHALLLASMAIEVPVYLLGPSRALHNHHNGGDSTGGGGDSAAEGYGYNGGGADDGLVEDALDDHLLALYPLHVLSFGLLYAACCLYVNQASKVVHHAARMRCLHWALLVASLGFMPLVAGCTGACWGGYRNTGPGSFSRFLQSRWFLALGVYSASALLLLAGAYLTVTCMLQRRMWGVLGPGGGSGSPRSSSSSSTSQEPRNGRSATGRAGSSRCSSSTTTSFSSGGGSTNGGGSTDSGSGGAQASFWAALCRMHVVMLTCTVSFVVRAALLVQLLTSVDEHDPPSSSSSSGTWAWLLYEEWVPATLPALGLLYLMRDARNAGPEAMRPTSAHFSAGASAGGAAAAPGLAGSSSSDRHWAGGGDVEMAAAPLPAVGAGGTPPRPKGKGPGQYQLVDEATY